MFDSTPRIHENSAAASGPKRGVCKKKQFLKMGFSSVLSLFIDLIQA
jgi:hypothetical protein